MGVFLKDVLKLKAYLLMHIRKVVSFSELFSCDDTDQIWLKLGVNCVEQNLVDRNLVLVHFAPVKSQVSMKQKSNVTVILMSCTDVFRCSYCVIKLNDSNLQVYITVTSVVIALRFVFILRLAF
jgi:hypothetical protein